MRHPIRHAALSALLSGALVTVSTAQADAPAMQKMSAHAAGALTWVAADVPGFPAGMKLAVIHGNPETAGAYTLRLSFPDGYRFPAHWHPMAENVTVLEGVLELGMGDHVDATKLKAYEAGAYLHIPAKMPHFGGAKGATVLQLHGEGPFAINVVGMK